MFSQFYTFKLDITGLDFSNVVSRTGMFADMIDCFMECDIDLDTLSVFYTNENEMLLGDWVDAYGAEELHTEIVGLDRELTVEELAI